MYFVVENVVYLDFIGALLTWEIGRFCQMLFLSYQGPCSCRICKCKAETSEEGSQTTSEALLARRDVEDFVVIYHTHKRH